MVVFYNHVNNYLMEVLSKEYYTIRLIEFCLLKAIILKIKNLNVIMYKH